LFPAKPNSFSRLNRENPAFKNGLWIAERKRKNWSEPEFFRVGMFSSSTSDGTLYYGNLGDFERDLLRSRYNNGQYGEPEVLEGIETSYLDAHPCIAPDESFLIFDSNRRDTKGPLDLFVSFKRKDGLWSEAFYLGGLLGEGPKMCATLSPDGKYIFYFSKIDIYWVDAKIIDELIPKELK